MYRDVVLFLLRFTMPGRIGLEWYDVRNSGAKVVFFLVFPYMCPCFFVVGGGGERVGEIKGDKGQ